VSNTWRNQAVSRIRKWATSKQHPKT
jgi:hypothetical protein